MTTKSEIKHWSNAKGDGKLFNVNLLDDTVRPSFSLSAIVGTDARNAGRDQGDRIQ